MPTAPKPQPAAAKAVNSRRHMSLGRITIAASTAAAMSQTTSVAEREGNGRTGANATAAGPTKLHARLSRGGASDKTAPITIAASATTVNGTSPAASATMAPTMAITIAAGVSHERTDFASGHHWTRTT